MGFDTDMKKVTERFKKWGETAVIKSEDFSAIEGMINYHYDARGRLFDDLLNALKRDTDIQSPWDNYCDKGLELNERLNSSIANKIPDGFRGLGMSDFYEGEKKAWETCKSGKIGYFAEAIFEIAKNDVEVFKKLEEDLKNSREDAKVVDELARAAYGDMGEAIRSFAVEIAAGLAAAPVAFIPVLGKIWAPQAKKAAKSLMGGSTTVRELTRKKCAARDVLVKNRELVDKAKSTIDDAAIENVRKRTEEIANSWKGAASRGDYNADDWGSFSRACTEVVANKAVPAVEKAKNLFYTMQPLYLEALKNTFVALTSDPSTLATFDEKLSADIRKMMEDLDKEALVIASLKDSDPKRAAVNDMKQIIEGVTTALKDLQDALKEAEKRLKS